MSSRPVPTRLDIVDKVTSIINTLNDEDLKSKIQHEIPVVIAVGDQSSGKSSIMGRILGHSLPSSAGITTKVPVVIQTRREPRDTSFTLKDVRGKSSSANNSDANLDSAPNNKNYFIEGVSLAEAVSIFQEEAMKGMKSTFSSESCIEVVVGFHEHDLTIIDLPGLIAYNKKDDDEEEEDKDNEIYDIVKDYLRMYRNAIIFHVVECQAEPEKIQSLKFVVKIANSKTKILNVMTKSDLITSSEREETFKQLHSKLKGGHVFAVSGNGLKEKQLESVSNYGLELILVKMRMMIRSRMTMV